jgi:hypothetical protein
VKLAGEALGIDSVCGFPIMIGREGWRLWNIERLDDFGRTAVMSSADAIRAFLNGVLPAPGSTCEWTHAEAAA